MAGLANGQRLDQQQQPMQRPGLIPHHSNSLPSTPYQKPRDLSGRHSKSPSPHRNSSNQSPRSVVSEAVGGSHGSRRNEELCKFETSDEIRKRRMPYIDGGDQELGPAKKEPRRTLEPDEQDRLSGDMRELYDRLLPSAESEERRAELVDKLDRILKETWPERDVRVNVFGSSGNLLSSTDSDVDICLTTTANGGMNMHSLAKALDKHGMQRVVCRAAAKVPIVKCWDPELGLATDLNVNNPLALQNTRLIKTYVQMDHRVRPLAKIIKYWTKQRILNDAAFGATISSYTWICMVISFLQRRNPPILPSLQNIEGCRLAGNTGEPSPFADDLEALKGLGDANKETLGELLFQFFRHYGFEFEYSKHVISVREGRLVSRKEKGWDPGNALIDKQANNRLCVEEPFTSERNLGNTADDYAWHGIHLEIRRAFDLLDQGLRLDKCCEQYTFPKEEKPVFQKPPPKPKPTLTRSASQSGQSNREPGSGGRSRKNNRNQSAQRAGNRRASSGASFSNQRLPFSPPLGASSSDYFHLKGNIHEQLAQQYQYLQAQQDALRLQLAQQQAQAQAQSRVGDLAGSSPRPRPYLNGLTSPRLGDNPPQTAPLLPAYLYHYPSRYPPPSPMSQARSREGTNTNPSSPSLMSAVPVLRRQAHRVSAPGDGSAGSVRSQSQPGRSLPHLLAVQQPPLPGYEMPGGLGPHYQGPRSTSQVYHSGHLGMPAPFSPYGQMHPSQSLDTAAMPKEYVGYYVGQSPQLVPQQFAAQSHITLPPMTLRDPPTRTRRVTPELLPLPNGRHNSRSPSPLGHTRSFSTTGDRRASQPTMLLSPTGFEQTMPILPVPAVPASLAIENDGGPVIVNGSNRASEVKTPERVNGSYGHLPQVPQDLFSLVMQPRLEENTRPRPGPINTDFVSSVRPREVEQRAPSSPRMSPTSQAKPDRRLTPLSPNGVLHLAKGVTESYNLNTPLTASLQSPLSPVTEQPTPSPTRARFKTYDSPEANGNGGLFKAAKLANAKQAQQAFAENIEPLRTDSRHERRGSAPVQAPSKATQAPKAAFQMPLQMTNQTPNIWQQVSSGKKGHKKNKSANGMKTPNGTGGQPMPANEAERKGG